jgi:hypothetical protein
MFSISDLVSNLELNFRNSRPVSFFFFLLYFLSFLYITLKLIDQILVF